MTFEQLEREYGHLFRENATLRAALEQYADHTFDCACRTKGSPPCDCGWTEFARAALEETK